VAISGFSVSYILFFVPVLTATALSIEREERTLDLLTVTLLSPRRIVLGKFVNSMRLMAVMAAGVLLLPVLHPIVRTIFGESVRGGYSIDYLLKIVVFLLGYSALFTSMGLLCSSYCRRNGAAIVTCFMAGLFMLLAPFVGLLLADLVDNTIGPRTGSRPAWMIVAAPLHFSLKLLAPLMSPFYYLSGLNQSQHGEFHNLFTNNSWKSWTVILLHAASVGALALAFLAAAARRLAREIR
jgi:ABC-type transport system involved in multi-copper enzyme maturation permease subunit